ncbi:F-box domain containing protein [Nitzschia inconspicua]|uniref:F-box domain containing protein n=1 Tax=Nitzschia inconspicua TaxID=303405 RepID=A0A9K3PY11_9STRA|nr:F-box domain containing protein [Nitzschia inconspicua]
MMDSLDTNDVNANNGHRVAADEPLSPQSQVFALIGILEHNILAYLETVDVLSATAVNRRWKQAGRNDDIWKRIIYRYWKNKSEFQVKPTWFFGDPSLGDKQSEP